MSFLGLKGHLLHSKKAWKHLSITLWSKLRKARRLKPVKKAKSALSTVLGRSASHRDHLGHRKSSISSRFPSNSNMQKLRHSHRSFQPVYVDDLVNRSEPVHTEPPPDTSKAKVFERGCKYSRVGGSSSTTMSGLVVGKLNEVDLRAEMFIEKFKEEMRLQRQRSFGEYQEMLARGV